MMKTTKAFVIKLIQDCDEDSLDIEQTRDMYDVTMENDTTNKYRAGELHFTISGTIPSNYENVVVKTVE